MIGVRNKIIVEIEIIMFIELRLDLFEGVLIILGLRSILNVIFK